MRQLQVMAMATWQLALGNLALGNLATLGYGHGVVSNTLLSEIPSLGWTVRTKSAVLATS